MCRCSKHNISAVFFVALAVCLQACFSPTVNATVYNNFLANEIVPQSSSIYHFATGRAAGCAFTDMGPGKRYVDHESFPLKLRMTLEEDWVSRILILNSVVKSTEHAFHLCSRAWTKISELTPSQGFSLFFSGLSPPSF